jgi:hypothetical protein
MSGLRPEHRRRAPRGILGALLIGAGAAALCPAAIVLAQETNGLRGEVAEADVNNDLLSRVPLLRKPTTLEDRPKDPAVDDQGIPTPAYAPASAGATPDVADTPDAAAAPDATATPKSIFENSADIVTDNPASAAPPTTAAKRAEARKKAGAPPETATERLAAKKKKASDKADEDAGTTGTVRAQTIDSDIETETKAEDEDDQRIERAAPIEGLDKRFDANPYAPLGLRVGTFTVLPSLESGLTATSNANSSPGGGSALLSESTLRLNAVSDWASDKATIDAFVNYRKTVSGEEIDETRAGLKGAFEHELGGDWTALGAIGYEVGPESASAPDAVQGVLDQPIKQTFEGSLGVEKDVGKLQLRLTGNVEREAFGDASLSTGGTVSQEDRNSTLVAGVLRTGYEISPALTPFVEVEYGHRFYDLDVDSNGFDRAATRTGARAGLELDLGEKFSGEFSAGWINEDLADPRLASVSGPSVSADLNWSPVRGTIVGLNALTTVEGSTSANDSGSILYASEITVERELRANLTAELGFAAGLRNYTGEDGRDVILGAEASTTYWFNRYLGLTGRLRHERLDSTLPNRDYKTNSVFLGLKLQR